MDPILITVKRSDEACEYDLAVQPDLPLSQVVEFIANGLNWKPEEWDFDVMDSQTGRKLDQTRTLSDANVWHGAKLDFIPARKKKTDSTGFVFIQVD